VGLLRKRCIAARHGLKLGDYTVLSVGSSQKRLEALSRGQAQGAVMFKPVADLLVAKGFNDLLAASDVLPDYQAAVAVARRSRATRHRGALVGFIRAYVVASRWFLDPANKEAAIQILMKYTPRLTRGRRRRKLCRESEPRQCRGFYRPDRSRRGGSGCDAARGLWRAAQKAWRSLTPGTANPVCLRFTL